MSEWEPKSDVRRLIWTQNRLDWFWCSAAPAQIEPNPEVRGKTTISVVDRQSDAVGDVRCVLMQKHICIRLTGKLWMPVKNSWDWTSAGQPEADYLTADLSKVTDKNTHSDLCCRESVNSSNKQKTVVLFVNSSQTNTVTLTVPVSGQDSACLKRRRKSSRKPEVQLWAAFMTARKWKWHWNCSW